VKKRDSSKKTAFFSFSALPTAATQFHTGHIVVAALLPDRRDVAVQQAPLHARHAAAVPTTKSLQVPHLAVFRPSCHGLCSLFLHQLSSASP
jgi:hypothetical protein